MLFFIQTSVIPLWGPVKKQATSACTAAINCRPNSQKTYLYSDRIFRNLSAFEQKLILREGGNQPEREPQGAGNYHCFQAYPGCGWESMGGMATASCPLGKKLLTAKDAKATQRTGRKRPAVLCDLGGLGGLSSRALRLRAFYRPCEIARWKSSAVVR